MLNNISILLSGIIAGAILFQSAVNAPLIFKSLNIEQARPLLRGIFPILFRLVAGLGIVITVLAITGDLGWLLISVGVSTAVLSITCAALVPATNRASDEQNQSRFDALHRLSVLLTVTVLIINIIWVLFA